MPLAIVHHQTTEERRRSSAQQAASGGLTSLQATLRKLEGDQERHEQLVGELAKRMAMRRASAKAITTEHRAMTFHQCGYVFVKNLGHGRHGMMKLAKRKSGQHVKYTKASVQGGEGDVVSQFVAVRVIQRCAVRRGRLEESELLSTKESHAVLLRHIQALRALDHPNIMREIETFEDPQQIYIVMELYTGGDLLERETAPLDEPRAAWIMSQAFAGIAHTHQMGIVHQDLRPDNIHYASTAPDSRVVITDWCCTEFIKTPPKESRQFLIFTEYSAPELEPSHRTDRGDVWSLGIVAFALLTFAIPFGAHSQRKERGDFAWHDSDVTVSPECKDFLPRLLRLDPAARLSAREASSHAWLAQARQAHRSCKRMSLSAPVASSLLRFTSSTVLHRTAAAIAADHLSGDQLAELTRQFEMIDKDGDGLVPKQDMIDALASTLQELRDAPGENEVLEADVAALVNSKSKVTALVNLMDTDGDGKISYSDFLAAAADANMSSCTALCWEAFRSIDRDGNGNISKRELQDLLETPIMDDVFEKSRQNGLPVARSKPELARALGELGGVDQSADEIFSALDGNDDRKISFEEFMQMMIGKRE